MKVSELRDRELDYFVAKAEGYVPIENNDYWYVGLDKDVPYRPSKDWKDGGPLLQKYGLGCAFDRPGVWLAVRATGPNYDTSLWSMLRSEGQETEGSTALEAICRAVVKAKFGDEVEGN